MNLINDLKEYDDSYFNKGIKLITDTEYDKLKTEAKKQFPDDPYFLEVGCSVSSYEEIKLPFIMGGLDKVDPETLNNWIKDKNKEICASEKLDGISIGCTWENGILSFASTRGNGITGQNILNKAIYFIPNIPVKQKVSLRGEILLKGETSFKKLGFRNRRNGVSGLIRRDNINPNDLKLLSAIFYEIIECPRIPEFEVYRFLYIQNTLKLQIPEIKICKPDENLISSLERFLLESKETKPYDIDGLVLTINKSQRENVMHPMNKVKFKVNESAITCKVLDIEWNVTRTGLIKPVILIEPVEIMGVTVSRVSGFNLDFIINNEIGKGSVIGVVRSGDVIPYVTEVYKTSKVIIPDFCSSCGSKTERYKKSEESTEELKCSNPECVQKKIYIVSHFFTTLGVEGMSSKTIKNLNVTSIEEMYNLTVKDIENLPGFGKKKAENIISEIKKTLLTKPELLLASFGIPLVGRTLSKQLCSKFSIDDLFNIKDQKDLGLGDITSETFIDYIDNYKDLYDFLKSKGLKFVEEDMSIKILKGLIFTLTGEGPMKRSEIQKIIEGLGGEVKGIGKSTKYLVTNDPESTSGKMKEAKKFGTEIISYDKLMEMINGR